MIYGTLMRQPYDQIFIFIFVHYLLLKTFPTTLDGADDDCRYGLYDYDYQFNAVGVDATMRCSIITEFEFFLAYAISLPL
jgi:hypothetical protein